MTRRVLGMAVWLVLGEAPATAQTVAVTLAADRASLTQAYGQDFALLVFSEHFAGQRQVALAAPPGRGCGEPRAARLVEVVPWRDGALGRAWTERYVLTCGPWTIRNLLMIEADGHLRVSPLWSGTSTSQPALERDIWQAVLAGAVRAGPPNCPQSSAFADRLSIEADPHARPGSWVETWQGRYCGTATMFAIRFGPDASGDIAWRIDPLP